MHRQQVSLIVPTFNEADNIIPLLVCAHEAMGSTPHEIIVVDDHSPDGTAALVEDFARSAPWVRLINRRGERGLSRAVLAGFAEARGSILGVMDADLSHDEAILPQLISAIQDGNDLAIGSRRIPGGGATEWPWFRRAMSSFATGLTKKTLGIKLSDPMSGYFFFRRSLFEACRGRVQGLGYKILLDVYCAGRPKRVQEIPFVFRDRRQGHSKISWRVLAEFLSSLIYLKKFVASRQESEISAPRLSSSIPRLSPK
jgi:dolichol-phosphate mannosyltransferase